jgi:hypothetical protein
MWKFFREFMSQLLQAFHGEIWGRYIHFYYDELTGIFLLLDFCTKIHPNVVF